MTTTAASPRPSSAGLVRLLLSLAVGGVAIGSVSLLLMWGWEYYLLRPAARPHHVYHEYLRPSGRSGLVFALVATGLFVLSLGYLVRKELIHTRWIGSLRAWMDCHAITGLVGAVLVLFHAAFAPSSALGILAIIALLITVLTGIAGRYIYAKVPRSLEGRELEIEQVRDRFGAFRQQLKENGVKADWLTLTMRPDNYMPPRTLPGRLVAMIRGDHQSRQEYRQLRRAILASPELRPSARRILPLAKAFCRYRHWLTRYHELRNLLASWRFLHRWLAIVMLSVVAVHIGLALRFGDLWILGGTP